MRRNEILVGVDGSAGSDAAVVWATNAAADRGAGLVIVHAFDTNSIGLWATTAAIRAGLREVVQPVLDDALRLARQCDPTVPVRGRVLIGSPTRILLLLSRSVPLTVVGRSGRGALARLWLGSITQRLLTHAGSPVVAVGAGTAAPVPGTVARVLVGVEDGGSPHAFAFAFEEAQQRDVRLLAVRVVPPVEWPTPSSPVPAQVIPDAEKQLSRTLIPWHALHPDVHLTPIVQSGRPGGTLVAMCRPDDLLVLGHRRRTSLTPRQLGPVVSAALHAAPCPVAVVLDPAANATG